jgi:molecular chaperone HscB
MNYFELFDIPVSLTVNAALLKPKFYELSRKYHPDVNSAAGGEQEALELSSLLNKAYKTFQHKHNTIKYVLQLKGLLEEEEKYNLDNDFLMEVMEINEELMEIETEQDTAKFDALKEKTNAVLKQIENEVEPVITNYKEGITTQEALLQVKDYYYKKKYLQRILDRLG